MLVTISLISLISLCASAIPANDKGKVFSAQGDNSQPAAKQLNLAAPEYDAVVQGGSIRGVAEAKDPDVKQAHGLDQWEIPDSVLKKRYFIQVTPDMTMLNAIEALNDRLIEDKKHNLISGKRQRMIGGKVLEAGNLGCYEHNGSPVFTTQPGRYWNLKPNHHSHGQKSLVEPIDFKGFTSAQVSQAGAMVVEDPENRIFIVRNGGFVAYGTRGRFRILETVDILNLGQNCAIYEDGTERILGWKKDVISNNVRVATFLNIPANNVAVVQAADRMFVLTAGQHCMLDPSTMFRRFYTLGERQVELRTKPATTIDNVPVELDVNLRYHLRDPLLLTRHYDTPIEAMAMPAQTAVTSIIARFSYQQFSRMKSIGGDIPDDQVGWLDEFKSYCLSELRSQAHGYGIVIESFDVLDRHLVGTLGKQLERSAEQVLHNQMQATQVELENRNSVAMQEGLLQKAKVIAKQTETESAAKLIAAKMETDASYYATMKAAEAEAEASALKAKQEAANILTMSEAKAREINVLSQAYALVESPHAQGLQRDEATVRKLAALPAKTIFFTGGQGPSNTDMSNMVLAGQSLGLGNDLNKED